MNNVFLKAVSLEDIENIAILEMMHNIGKDENGFGNPGFGLELKDYPAFIKKMTLRKTNPDINTGHTPQTVFWLFDGNEVIGLSKMRSVLSDELRISGGNIGYGIRKEKRNMGYGTILLKLTLDEIRNVGVTSALLTCDADNLGSRKVIENNNGILDKQVGNECYYWIKL